MKVKWDVHQRKYGHKDTLGNSRLRKTARDVGTLEQGGMSRKRERLSSGEKQAGRKALCQGENLARLFLTYGLPRACPKLGEAGDPEVSPVLLVRMMQTSGLKHKEVLGLPGAQGKEETGKQGSSSTLLRGCPQIRPPHHGAHSCCFRRIARLLASLESMHTF